MKKIQILIVEDEKKLARTMEDYLRIQGYGVLKAEDGRQALDLFFENQNKIDLVILDLMLPQIPGLDVLKEIRKLSDVPVLILTSRSTVEDQISGFEKGADDYMTKPYSLKLLKMHVEALLKRAGKLKTEMCSGHIRVDVESQRVYWKERYIETTPKEYELLVYFMEHSDVVLTRDAILNGVWGYDYVGDIRTVDTLVKQLRKKLSEECDYIRSIYGTGYLFEEKKSEE